MASVLQDLGMPRFTVLERSEVGATFLAWPEEMRLITPSFTSNAYGMMDLNAVAGADGGTFCPDWRVDAGTCDLSSAG